MALQTSPSFRRTRKSGRCRKAVRIQRRGTHDPPRNAPELHSGMHQSCTRRADMVRSWCVPKTPRHPTGQASRADLRYSRACGNPVGVRKRPRFSAEGCTIAPGVPLNCIQTCTKHALGVRSWCARWCVPKTPRTLLDRHPELTCVIPRVLESSRCQKASPIRRRRMHDHPSNATEVHSNLYGTCTDCALAVRSEDFTAPYWTGSRS